MFLLLLSASAQFNCQDINNDDLFFDINPDCNYRGKCITLDNGDPACECCRPYSAGNYCYGQVWLFGDWDGADGCLDYTHYLYSILQYVFHMTSFTVDDATWAGREGEFKCRKGSSGNGVYFGGDFGDPLPEPNLIPFLNVMLASASTFPTLVNAGYDDYDGTIVQYFPENSPESGLTAGKEHCRICLDQPSDHCLIVDNSQSLLYGPNFPNPGQHLMVSFATNFNTYYGGDACAKNPATTMPTNEGEAISAPACPSNSLDRGQEAHYVWRDAITGNDQGSKHQEQFIINARESTSTVIGQDLAGNDVFGMGWTSNIEIEKLYISYKEHSATATSPNPPPSPTDSPSPAPTKSPTDPPVGDCFALGYTHTPEMLEFKAIAQAGDRGCRWGLLEVWPGGTSQGMCESPYVLCLPQANTPNVGFPTADGPDLYFSDTHQYTLDECKKECAYDQRCNGFEFVASSAQIGECNLIDDLIIETKDPDDVGAVSADPSITNESELLAVGDWSGLGGAVCYEKNVPCNPYFQQDELDDVMLTCYCPNNRKGFYTKNVVRTVDATHYCGVEAGSEVTDRIREAQANRMFHLCENWCLFNTQDPMMESWYHDPWEECWREQYAGVGKHRSYCYRVIRDPMTIEMQFMNNRATNMCPSNADGQPNTPAPTWGGVQNPLSVTWLFAAELDSCDDACEAISERCAADMMGFVNKLTYDNAADFATGPFDAAGGSCDPATGYTEGAKDWAFPGITAAGECILRNDETTLETGCNVAIGVGYQRLCACTTEGMP